MVSLLHSRGPNKVENRLLNADELQELGSGKATNVSLMEAREKRDPEWTNDEEREDEGPTSVTLQRHDSMNFGTAPSSVCHSYYERKNACTWAFRNIFYLGEMD